MTDAAVTSNYPVFPTRLHRDYTGMGTVLEVLTKLGVMIAAWVVLISCGIFLTLWKFDELPLDLVEHIGLIFAAFVVALVTVVVQGIVWLSKYPEKLAKKRQARKEAAALAASVERILYGKFQRLTVPQKAVLRLFRDGHFQQLPYAEAVRSEESKEAVRRLVLDEVIFEMSRGSREHRIVLYDDTWAAITHRPKLFDA